jgi:hypothetical protein
VAARVDPRDLELGLGLLQGRVGGQAR